MNDTHFWRDFRDAIVAGDVDGIRKHVAEGAPPGWADRLDRREETPLHWAACADNATSIRLLVSLGANTENSANDSGFTPLRSAISLGFWDAAEALLECGANPNARDTCGNTPLLRTCQAIHPRSYQMAKILVAHGADVNALGGSNETALHVAARTGSALTCELLIREGVKVNRRNILNETALDGAIKADEKLNALLLIAHGAYVAPSRKMGSLCIGEFTPKRAAAAAGLTNRLLELLEEDPEPAGPKESLRFLCASARQAGHEETAQVIEAFGARRAISTVMSRIQPMNPQEGPR